MTPQIKAEVKQIIGENGEVIARRYNIYFVNENKLPDHIINACDGQVTHYTQVSPTLQRLVIDIDA